MNGWGIVADCRFLGDRFSSYKVLPNLFDLTRL